MLRAVIFDWHGTLATWEHGRSNYEAVFAELGLEVDSRVINQYFASWDGVDHSEHSASEERYSTWTRWRLEGLVKECGIQRDDVDRAIAALLAADANPMVAFPESIAVLQELRQRGFGVAVCSNWGWNLEGPLAETGISPHVDAFVTSAQVGVRKPHPAIYAAILEELELAKGDVVFVGDSWGPDVVGPLEFGMAAIHISRDHSDRPPPELPGGARRIGSLTEFLADDRLGEAPAGTI